MYNKYDTAKYYQVGTQFKIFIDSLILWAYTVKSINNVYLNCAPIEK